MNINEKELNKATYDQSRFSGTWDCERFISALVELAANDALDNQTDNVGLTVKQLRVYSAFCAFTGKEWNGEKIDCLTTLHWIDRGNLDILYSEDDLLKIKELLGQRTYKINVEELLDNTRKQGIIIGLMFSAILRYRASVEKALTCYDGYLAASMPFAVGFDIAKEIYDTRLKECNRKADEVLMLMLGKQFQKTISEQELIEHYHYPTVTDEEIHETMIENL